MRSAPGDSLPLTAGLLAPSGLLDERIPVPELFIAAVAGHSVGHGFGARTGPRVFSRPQSLIFRRDNRLKVRAFYGKRRR